MLSVVYKRTYKVTSASILNSTSAASTAAFVSSKFSKDRDWFESLEVKHNTSKYTCCTYYGKNNRTYSSSFGGTTIIFGDNSCPDRHSCAEQKRIIAVLSEMYEKKEESFGDMVYLGCFYMLSEDNVSALLGISRHEDQCCSSVLGQILNSEESSGTFDGILRDVFSQEIGKYSSQLIRKMEMEL